MYTVHGNTFITGACFRLKFLNKIIEETALHHHVWQIIDILQTTRSVLNEKSTGKPQTNENVMGQVQALVEENPHSSLRRLSARTDVSFSTIRRVL